MRNLSKVLAAAAAGIVFAGMGITALPANAASTTTTQKPTTTTQKPKAQKKKPPPKPKLPTPHIGQVAKDGNFAFKVVSVQCGTTTLGTEPLTTTAPAGSQWCLANMEVKNIKGDSRAFSASDQYAFDGKNRKLDADAGSIIYMPNGSSSIFETVNPGVIITVTVPYQMPTTSKIKKFELHDSPFSGGVTVWNVQ